MHEGTYWPVFEEVFNEYKPKTIVEIGSYYGGLSYNFHKLLKDFFVINDSEARTADSIAY